MTTITEQEFLDRLEEIIDQVAKGDIFIIDRPVGSKIAVIPYNDDFLKFWEERKKMTTLTIQINSGLKQQLEVILSPLHLSIGEAINLFIAEIARQGKIPFEYTEADLEEAINNPVITIIE